MSMNGRAAGRPPTRRPLYTRALGLRYVRPSALLSFLLFECMIALAALLALAELVSWWAVVVLPVSVAAMVKVNDVVTGAMRRSALAAVPRRRVAAPLAPSTGARGGTEPARMVPAVRREQDAETTTQRGHRFADAAARRYREAPAGRSAAHRHTTSTNERRFRRSA